MTKISKDEIKIGDIVGVQDMEDEEVYRIGKVIENLSKECFKVEASELKRDLSQEVYTFVAHIDEIESCYRN